MAGIKKGVIVYASNDCRASFEEAKAHATAQGWTRHDVRIYRDDGMLLMETTRKIISHECKKDVDGVS